MFKLNNYFGSDDCFLFRLITITSILAIGFAWMLAS